ncbi:MAG: hypothetical protein KIS91_04725 [Anaerolineae bacterium]|nr:hypothetical protein [Anaerolineae bacterium]
MYATLHHATDWAAHHRLLLAALLAVIVFLVLIVPIVRPPRWPSPDPPVAVAPAAPAAHILSLTVALERPLARLRDLGDSGDPILDNGYLPQRVPGQWV